MHSSLLSLPSIFHPQSKTPPFHGSVPFLEIPPVGFSQKSLPLPFQSFRKKGVLTMRDRSKNRKPLQRGRISIEAIQTVQSLKRAKKNDPNSLDLVFQSKVSRLLKQDLIAVLRELQRQGEGLLALQVFQDIQKEHWYKPQLLIYADMIAVLANNGLFDKVELLFSHLRIESLGLEHDVEGFNAILRTLFEYSIFQTAMDCFHLMKEVGCEPDESTFRILINGFESKGEERLSAIFRQEGEKYFGRPLEVLEREDIVLTSH
ncbi:pentatricopeptide repeat-containing protein At1g62350-like [Tasmannia lanceolata]|uniref:pentatricopeptide repeat-containing protein At1g62350-like n=1 Tax=Tasmannia lanceolata TaxID=3420 RepID=UPI004062C03D